MKIRIVKITHRGETTYRIEKKFLFWWFNKIFPSFHTFSNSDAILTRSTIEFSSFESCRKIFVEFFELPTKLNYQGHRIQKRYKTDGYRHGEPSYVDLSWYGRDYGYKSTFKYDHKLENLFERIQKKEDKPKKEIVKTFDIIKKIKTAKPREILEIIKNK